MHQDTPLDRCVLCRSAITSTGWRKERI